MKDWITRLRRLLIPSSVIALPLSFMAFAAPAALAATYDQFCESGQCINQWGGGPNVMTSGTGHINNACQMILDTSRCNDGRSSSNCPVSGVPIGLQIVYLEDVNPSSPYIGECLGDYGNSSTDTNAGVNNPCDPGGGWGTVFLYAPGTNGNCTGSAFNLFNVHWSSSWSNRVGISWPDGLNNQIVLNTPSPKCLTESTFND